MSRRLHVLGRGNGIGGFRKNLVTFRESKLPDFSSTQKCVLENAVQCTIKKITSLILCLKNSKWWEISEELTVNSPR
jgi:hypothetical protein